MKTRFDGKLWIGAFGLALDNTPPWNGGNGINPITGQPM